MLYATPQFLQVVFFIKSFLCQEVTEIDLKAAFDSECINENSLTIRFIGVVVDHTGEIVCQAQFLMRPKQRFTYSAYIEPPRTQKSSFA